MKNLIKTTFLLTYSILAFTASLSLHGQTTADLQTQLNAETAAREAEDTALGNRITDETTARTNADGATRTGAGLETDGSYTADSTTNYLGTATSLKDADKKLDEQLNSEFTARTTEDTNLGNRITDETTAREAADGATRTGAGLGPNGDYAAYTESNYINEAISLHDADRLLDEALKSESNARIAEDALLRTDINSNRADIDRNRVDINRNTSDIQRNREGIAMVAAMTHTTLLPGNDTAFDIGVATFESETAYSINFARRVKEGVQVNLSAASTSGLSDAIVRGSIGFQW